MPLTNADRRKALDLLKENSFQSTPFVKIFRYLEETENFIDEAKQSLQEIESNENVAEIPASRPTNASILEIPRNDKQLQIVRQELQPRSENRPIMSNNNRYQNPKEELERKVIDSNIQEKYSSLDELEDKTQEFIDIPTEEELSIAERRDKDLAEITELKPESPLTLENPKELQNKIISAGFSVGKTGVDGKIGKNTITGLQEFLISKGYELPKYGVDGKLGKETQAALNAYNKSVSDIESPYRIKYDKEEGFLGKCDEDQCSAFVQNEFRRRTGIMDTIDLGMHGNAWDIARNMKNRGAASIYNRDAGFKDYDGLIPGSVVTMYTGGRSNYQSQAGKGNPTHVGVVDSEVQVDEKTNKPFVYILHNEHARTPSGYQGRMYRHKMYLNENPNVAGYRVVDIVTPPVEGVGNFRAMPNEELKISAPEHANDVAKAAVGKINDMKFKDMFMNDFKLEEKEYQSIAKASLGIMGQESKFGDIDSPLDLPVIRDIDPIRAKEVLATIASPIRGQEESRGYGRIKFNTNFSDIKDRLATDYGLDKKDISVATDDGSKSIMATMLVISKYYNNFKNSKSVESDEEALYLAMQKYNRYNLARKIDGKSSYDYAKERSLDYVNKALMYAESFSATDGYTEYETLIDKLNRDERVIRQQGRRFSDFGLKRE